MIGRSLREWTVQRSQVRTGHLRPHDGARPHQVDLVAGGSTYGALRRFADRDERAHALTFLGIAGHIAPVLLDIVDAAESPYSIVTAWAPGRSKVPLSELIETDDLLARIEEGHRWKPAEALRLLIPLGHALDRLAARGFVPVELSPDHLIENGGGIRLVGLGRHLYLPSQGRLPNPYGMSLPTSQLLCGELPGPSAKVAEWRDFQVALLLRLAGWMCGGLPPGSWGQVGRADGQAAYLRASGFASHPVLQPGRLAETLADAAVAERAAEARLRVERAECVLFFDEAAGKGSVETREEWQKSLLGKPLDARVIEVEQHKVRIQFDGGGERWPMNVHWRQTPEGKDKKGYVDLTQLYDVGRHVTAVISQIRPPVAEIVYGYGDQPRARAKASGVTVNAESVRLGLLEEHGPEVVAVAAVAAHRQASPGAALLSGAGWVLVAEEEFTAIARTIVRRAPSARIVVAGRAGRILANALSSGYEEILPNAAAGPSIGGRSASALPFIADPDLNSFSNEVLHGEGGASLRRRTFSAGWALKLSAEAFRQKQAGAARDKGRQLRNELVELSALYGTHTELLLRVMDFCGRPALRAERWNRMRERLRLAAPVLSGMPATGALRNDLMHALLSRTTDTLYKDVTRRLLPVVPRLSEVYDPELRLGGTPLNDLLYTIEGIRRLGLLGRLATALPSHGVGSLLDSVAALSQAQVDALLDVPAPSLQFLVGKLGSARLLEVLEPFIDGPDLDLLGQFPPRAWSLLLDGLRQPEHLSALGLGWALVVDRDAEGKVDARSLLEIARLSGKEARYAVRALLEVHPAQWPVVLGAPEASAAWLSAFGRLDLAPVLASFPHAASLLRTFSPAALRAAASVDLTEDLLAHLSAYADGAGIDPAGVVMTFLDLGASADDIDAFRTPAAGAWTAARLAGGASLADTMADLIESPGLLRAWLVTGDRLPRRVLTDVLGAETESLSIPPEEGRALVELLEAQPGLLALARSLVFPGQRLALLRLALADTGRSLAVQPVADALPGLLDHPSADAIVTLILDEGLTAAQAVDAFARGLGPEDRALARLLGPLPITDDLLAISREYGLAAARDTAVLAQTRPDAPAAVRAWGPHWIPVLASSEGAHIARLLAGRSAPSPESSHWLLAAGEDGLRAFAAFGPALLALAVEAQAAPQDVHILTALLTLGGDAAAHRLITGYGLPPATWPTVAAHSHLPAEDLLLDLWSSDRWIAT
ncbi:hypothetical protein [Actinocorallia libanotica]|uniref:HEAT repeat protein n=1 Tax=Actinocorallia libanotica TaxID=46162 RepID=A0ABP4C381_9ACTN